MCIFEFEIYKNLDRNSLNQFMDKFEADKFYLSVGEINCIYIYL